MQSKVRINRSDLAKLQPQSLLHLSKLIKAKIIEIGELGHFSFPATSIHAYLYLENQLQRGTGESADVLDFIHSILTNKQALIDCNNPHSDDSALLVDAEIIETILEINPKIIQMYRIEDSSKASGIQVRHGRLFISDKESYAVGNIQNLCMAALKKERIGLSLLQCLAILREVLFPIYFGSYVADSKPILEAIKRIFVVHQANHLEQQLSKLFLSFYQEYWSTVIFSSSSIDHIGALEKQFTLLEVIHHSSAYPQELVKSLLFRLHLKGLLQFSGENRGSVHLLAIKVYERAAICLGEMGNNAQVFIKLFNILSCYGSHLVKDVWGCFYGLVQGHDSALFQKLELIDIVLGKLEHHENSNVIKNCLHELLKNEQSNRIFELTPSIIYSSLIRMLNLGVHYLDCMFHMDSKMYSLVAAFFLRYYNSSPAPVRLQQHFAWLLEAIVAKTNYDHALIALIGVFQKQCNSTTFVDLASLNSTKPLLVAAYSRFPIRKRFQLVNGLLGLIIHNINRAEVKVRHLLEYFSLINEEYLIDENLDKLRNILDTYPLEERQLWAKNAAEEIVSEVKMHLNSYEQLQGLDETYSKIRMIELYQRLYHTHFEEYEDYFLELVEQYGESQYKNLRQRQIIITIYSLIKNNLIAGFKSSRFFVPHLDAVLNSIALYSQLRYEQPSEVDCKGYVLQIVSQLFRRSYGRVEGEEFKEREGERVVLARMMQWASDRLDTDSLALSITIEACRARIQILMERRRNPLLYLNYQHLFQETLYDLYDQLSELENNQKFKCKCSALSKDKQLRLRVLVTTILLNDSSHRVSHSPPSCSDIGDIIDRYDFQSYEEVCWLIQTLYSNNTVAFAENKNAIISEQQASNLAKQLDLLLENMVHNLEYSLGKKEIVAISECTMQVLLSFAYNSKTFSRSLASFASKLIQSGESYLIFQRVIALALANQIYLNFSRLSELNCTQLIPLLINVLTIEEYRGFDSAVYLNQENSFDKLYHKFEPSLQSNYEGANPRFITIFALREVVRGDLGKKEMVLLQQMIESAIEICMSVVAKEKMFLSGRNKLKLQLWQFLLVLPPAQLPIILGKEKFDKLILRCIDAISHNLISEIRYYSEMFLMRVLTEHSNFTLISNDMLQALQKGLLSSVGNVNRTISYIVVSGILIKYISGLGESHPHFNSIKEAFVGLYNSLLTYVGSSVAYFRGLSQFFCLQFISGCLETKYVSILRENFLMDKDAEHLIAKLREIMNSYMVEMQEWEVQKQVLRKTPNNNRNVVSETYYMDTLKQFSTELAKINKNLDGFTAYRYIWKKNVARGEALEEEEGEDEPQGQDEVADQGEEDIFQRKIDPTLDHLYSEEKKSQLKLLVTSSKSQALIGHLARTGEIFGIEELIVPCKKVIQLDQFKSISVTAERWLNITDLGSELNAPPKAESILRCLVQMKSEGFEIVRLAKWSNGNGLNRPIKVNRKCVLLLDEAEQLSAECLRLLDWDLQVGRHLSLHVQASIFIWSYFKQYVSK